MRINKHDTQGTKPLLGKGELGYDDYSAGGDTGRVYVGTGTENIPVAKKSEVTAVDGKADAHIARVDNPHGVTKAQVGLGLADNTADASKNVLSATKWTTARTITLSGDIAGSASVDGSANVTIATTVQPNSVALGTDTTGNYVAGVTAGTGISISGTAGEGWSPTITNTAPNVTTNITTTHNAADVVVNSSDGTDGTIDGATQTLAGVMTAVDKVKLDGIAAGATANTGTVTSIATSGAITGGTITSTGTISHRTSDGYLHVPATGTTNSGKVLTAGDTAGSLSWATIPSAPVTSVAGKTGDVTLVKDDVGLGSVDNTADSTKNVLSATKLTTARTIALSGGATGTATSFDGTNNISIPVTGLNASNLNSGTVPDARLSGVYSGMSLKLNGNNTVFTTESSGSSSTSRTVYGLAEYKGPSTTTGAIVLIAPSSSNAVMHQLEVSGLLYNQNIVSLIVQGYRTTGAWSDLRKISTGTADIQVRWGVTPDGKNCLILGDVGTVWSYPHIAITRAMFSHSGVSDAYCTGWTVALVTSFTGYTNLSANIADSTMIGNVSSATKLATARTINGVNFDGTANIVAPTNLTIGTITTTAVPIESSSGTNASIPAATTALAGVMSSADKVKLDGIAAGAQVNVATNLGITAGTTAGPTVTSSTGTNATLPTASASASGVVTTGNQTWAGVKTFSSNPISTATQSTAVNALTRKDYVDSLDTSNVKLTGDQTIAGVKTFSSSIVGNISGNADSATTLTGLTTTVDELNKIDGFTGTVSDLNYAKDLRATGVTATEFDYLYGVTSNIQTQLNAKASLQSTNITVNVGTGQTYTTINQALEYLSGFYPLHKTAGVTAIINLKAGFVMAEQVLVRGLNLGWITIVGEDAETIIIHTALTTDFNGYFPAFGVDNGGISPVIGQLFRFNVGKVGGNKNGILAYGAGSSAEVLNGKGFIGSGWNGIAAHNGAIINAEGANASNSGNVGIAATNAIINAYGANASNAGNYGIYTQHGAIINANSANASNAGNYGIFATLGSTINAYGANASNSGSFGIAAYGASTINAEDANVSNAGSNGITATSSTINAANVNASNAGSIGIYAASGSTITANNAIIQNQTTGTFRVKISGGSIISTYGIDTSGGTVTVSNQPVNTLTQHGIIFR